MYCTSQTKDEKSEYTQREVDSDIINSQYYFDNYVLNAPYDVNKCTFWKQVTPEWRLEHDRTKKINSH